MRLLTFASIQVKDLEKSKDFYTRKLGFGISSSLPDACIFNYGQGEASFAIRKPLPGFDGKEPGIGVSLWFAIDGTIEDLQHEFNLNDVEMQGQVNNTPFGKTLNVRDPDGYNITFLEPRQ